MTKAVSDHDGIAEALIERRDIPSSSEAVVVVGCQ